LQYYFAPIRRRFVFLCGGYLFVFDSLSCVCASDGNCRWAGCKPSISQCTIYSLFSTLVPRLYVAWGCARSNQAKLTASLLPLLEQCNPVGWHVCFFLQRWFTSDRVHVIVTFPFLARPAQCITCPWCCISPVHTWATSATSQWQCLYVARDALSPAKLSMQSSIRCLVFLCSTVAAFMSV